MSAFRADNPSKFSIFLSIQTASSELPAVSKHEIVLENGVNHDKYKNNRILSDKLSKSFANNVDEKVQERRRKIEELKVSSEKQHHYENQLKKMGIPVIMHGLVNENRYDFMVYQSKFSSLFVLLSIKGPANRHPPPKHRLVHFDLKGAPLKPSFIIKVLPMLKTLGATGIIMEYEDMFPYSGNLAFMRAKNSYNETDIHKILMAALALKLNVIPLIQTFGHLEFALKLNEMKSLRESPDSPQSICPSSNASRKFIDEMLTQIINMHTIKDHEVDFTHIHIGCDEVYQLGQCSKCRERIRDELFLDHIYNVASMVKSKKSNLDVIIWDDHLRAMPLITLKNSAIGKMVQPMVWVYAEDIYRFIQSNTWEKYAQIFTTSWVAGAFKGAFGERLLVPQGRRHLENTLKWLAIIQSEGQRFSNGIQGIALTGWSRYDHFAVLCELFLTGIPSLAMSLHTASNGYFDIDSTTNPIIPALTCPDAPSDRFLWLDMQKDPNLNSFSRCLFPGSSIFRHITRLALTIDETRQFIDSIKYSRGWLTYYNVQHNFTSNTRIAILLEDKPRLEAILTNSAKTLFEVMIDFYDEFTIGEFIEQNIYPYVKELNDLEAKAQKLMKFSTFPVRPFPYFDKYFKENDMM